MVLSRRKLLKLSVGGVIGVGVSTIGGVAYATKIEPEALEITRREFALPNLPKAFDGLTIVQISDLHVGDWMTSRRLLDIAHEVNALQPDIIAITGDFVSGGSPDSAAEMGRALSNLIVRE